MSLFDRFFGSSARAAANAVAAESRGDLSRAAALFVKAGRRSDAARMMILQGDRETGFGKRMRCYAKAAALAPDGSEARATARTKRALVVIALAEQAPLTGALRRQLLRAAGELEAAGDHLSAAAAYARADDGVSQARALAQAGAVDALDAVLDEDVAASREARSRRDAHAEFLARIAIGDRRRALDIVRTRGDESLRAQARVLEAGRVAGTVLHVTLRGEEMAILLGDEVVIGRAPDAGAPDGSAAALAVPSPALSRRHVAIARRGPHVFVRDLGSHNGTLCAGRPLVGELAVGERCELLLGGNVRVVVRPGGSLPGSVTLEVGPTRYVAALGPAAWLGAGRWRIEAGADGWFELVTENDPPAFAEGIELSPRVTLLAGDAFGTTRGAAPLLRVRTEARDPEDPPGPC